MNIIKSLFKISFTNLCFVILLLLPILFVFFNLDSFNKNFFTELQNFKIFVYLKNTIIILFLVIVFSSFFAIISAYFIARYSFYGKKLFSFLSILPLAIPSYIMGYAYVMFFEYSGVLFNFLGIYINIFNIGMVSFIISISLFSYLFVLLKSSFNNILNTTNEDLTNFNVSERYILTKLLVPLSKFAIFAGLALIVMETFNEYGLVSYFGFNTISSIIFKLLYNLDNMPLAFNLSFICVIIIIVITIFLSKFNNTNKQKFKVSSREHNYKKIPSKLMLVVIYLWFFGLFIITLALPIITLGYKAINHLNLINISLLYSAFNTITLSFTVAIIASSIMLVMLFLANLYNFSFNKTMLSTLILGYATPSAIIGIGVLLLQKYALYWYYGSSLILLIYALVFKYIYTTKNALNSYYIRYSNINEITTSLNTSKIKSLFKVNLPLTKKPILLAFLLVFLDVSKELPLTLLLKPMNFNTLAVQSYYYANNELLSQSSIFALVLIILVGFIVWLCNR